MGKYNLDPRKVYAFCGLCAVVADACNKVPYDIFEGGYICPADLIGCRVNQIRIEEISSKLIDLNNMMKGLSQYYKIVNNARNEILR